MRLWPFGAEKEKTGVVDPKSRLGRYLAGELKQSVAGWAYERTAADFRGARWDFLVSAPGRNYKVREFEDGLYSIIG